MHHVLFACCCVCWLLTLPWLHVLCMFVFQNVWKMSSQNFCADVLCGGVVIWDKEFSPFVQPAQVLGRYRQIFNESTEPEVSSGARILIDFCKQTRNKHTTHVHNM